MPALRKILYCALLLTLLGACNQRPEGVLSRSTMRKVLIDLHKTDGLISVKNYRGEQKDECYQSILEGYGISQAQFDSSIVWYSSKPKVFEKIYQDVMDELQAENDFLAQILQQQRNQKNMQKPELAFLDSLTPKFLKQAPDSQRIYLDILLGTYQEPAPEPFAMRSIYQLQLQDSIFQTLKDTTGKETVKKTQRISNQRGLIRRQTMRPEKTAAPKPDK